jgi:transcriptional regulator of aromatic amino acid metabolism
MNVSQLTNALMQAAVFHGGDRITIERVAIPEAAMVVDLIREAAGQAPARTTS